MNNIIYNLPFLLFFIPLIGSVLTSLITNKKINISITLASMFGMLGVLLWMVFDYQTSSTMYVNIQNNITLLGGEYRLNIFNIYIALILNIMYIFMFVTTNYEILGKENNDGTYRRFFFSTYLLNMFSAIGILFTSNICNYFIFLEIYIFTIYTVISNSRNTENLLLAYSSFNQNIISSFIILLSIFGFILYFNTTNMLFIYQKFLTINLIKNPVILLLVLFYMIGIIMKFFYFHICLCINTDKNEKILNNNFISFLNLFINVILGSYCLLFFSNYLFNITEVFSNVIFTNILIIIISGLIGLLFVYLIKNFTLSNILLKFLFVDLLSMFLLIILNNNFTMYLSFLSILGYSLINASIFLITNILYNKYNTSEICLLNNEKILKYSFVAVLLVKIGIPLTFLFSYNYNYILMASTEKNLLLYIPFILIKAIYIFVATKIISNKEVLNIEISETYNCRKDKIFTVSLYSIMAVIFMFIFFSSIIKNLIGF